MTVVAFDIYGTLINTQGITDTLQTMVDDADSFAVAWRQKQLEYAFRRGLMRRYADFAACTTEALNFVCLAQQTPLSEKQKRALLENYRRLPAFDDAKDGLINLQNDGMRLYAFSNGTAAAVDDLLTGAGLREFFTGIISVDDVRSFKPDPAVYMHFLRTVQTTHNAAWLVSSNTFDILGAMSVGMETAWVRRQTNAVFDPWGDDAPSLTLSHLGELATAIRQYA